MASGFDILPAIDLRGGLVVRLEQGDFGRETAFSADPVAVASRFVDDGAAWLHVVDLDGAIAGGPAQAATVRSVIDAVGDRVSVEVAGGLRSAPAVAAALASGATRVVIGTAALGDTGFVRDLIATHGADRIVVALDVRDGQAIGEGWRADAASVGVEDAIGGMADAGVQVFEITAIERDGLLGGPDLALYQRLVGLRRGGVIASGGVAVARDVTALRIAGCRGVIIGRALYDGGVSLREVIDLASDRSPEVILSPRVRRRLDLDYAGVDKDRALAILVDLDVGTWSIGADAAGRERIHAALLRLAGGNLRRLEREAGEAAIDWRDVLVAADLAGEDWPDRVRAMLGDTP